MSNHKSEAASSQMRWAFFRFAIIGPLLSAPPEKGSLRAALEQLAQQKWQHPISGIPVKFSASTIERWFYLAKNTSDPVKNLRYKLRSDAQQARGISNELKRLINQQYSDHPGWSCQLHKDNLVAQCEMLPELGAVPSYSTIHRYMKTNGLRKRRSIRQRETEGARIASARLEAAEVRSFEMDYVHSLWHLDFHHGSRKILDKNGVWRKPLLLCILDDRSRMVCHLQWYFEETSEVLIHGFKQALQKRGLPRSVMSDNGGAMTSDEFTQGLTRLSILHEPTLPYSPYQNAKQEVFWAQVEGRLMAMLENEPEMDLSLMNKATLAWAELEYHRKVHSEIKTTPLNRYLEGPSVDRECPDSKTLRQNFCIQVKRKQRRSDGTFSLDGTRIEVPSQYRHLETLHIRYARWDLSYVMLVDSHTDAILAQLYPQDKSANSSGKRRALAPLSNTVTLPKSSGIAPLLKNLMEEYSATGLPPAYIPKEEGKAK